MQKSAQQEGFESRNLTQYKDGIRKRNKPRQPLEFLQLKKVYYNTVNQFIDLLQRISLPNEEYDNNTRSYIRSPLKIRYIKTDTESVAKFDEEVKTNAESAVKSDEKVKRADSPDMTKFDFPLTRNLGPISRPILRQSAGTAKDYSWRTSKDTIDSRQPSTPPSQRAYALHPPGPYQQLTQPAKGVHTGYPQNPYEPHTRVNTRYPLGSHQSQNPSGGGVDVGYLQDSQTPSGVSSGYPQDSYQTQTPPGEAFHVTYPKGPYQPQTPSGVSAGYLQGSYPPQIPPGQRVQVGYLQGPYQPQPLLGEGVHAGYPPGQQQSYSPLQDPPFSQPERQYPLPTTPWGPPQSAFGQFPLPTRSASRRSSPSPTRSPSRGPKYTGISNMSPDGKRMYQQNETTECDRPTLQVEIQKSLKDIDKQFNFILNNIALLSSCPKS